MNSWRTLPGRLLLLSAGLVLVLWIAQETLTLPAWFDFVRKAVTLVFIVCGAWVSALVLVRNWRKFLWRVRRKLLLSYLFLGVVPIVLVLAFALAGGVVLYDTLAAYLVRQGIDDLVAEAQSIAGTAAAEIGRNPAAAPAVIANRYENWASQYPDISLSVLPVDRSGGPQTAGPWRHQGPPTAVPEWVTKARGFSGPVVSAIVPRSETAGTFGLVLRAVVPTSDGRRMVFVDLPVGTDVVARIEGRTGARIVDVTRPASNDAGAAGKVAAPTGTGSALAAPVSRPFQRTVAFIDVMDWDTNRPVQVAVSLEAPVRQLSQRISSAQSVQFGGLGLLLIVLAVLLMIIQGSALVMGGALARSITYAVHELFVGTERVREGDFTHRIRVDSQDQLGDLADSFNRMSGSIEHLLHVQREKQRLDDELRIAREIQKSLLPVRPPELAGLSIADLCEPAREVGGDYYDFFDLGPRQLGVLIADVSGKGTSAALYMAELKGLMLALSHTERSPRLLLSTVNHLLAEHLDNRSFITATYAVIDLERMTLTCARAGHTPMIIVSGGRSELVVPGGMVLGLRLPGASQRFEEILEEHTRPLNPGDQIVLYTDGITEATDVSGELFGDEALAQVLTAAADLEPAAVRERVVRAVRAFVGDAEPHDDMTMVVMRIEPSRAAGPS